MDENDWKQCVEPHYGRLVDELDPVQMLPYMTQWLLKSNTQKIKAVDRNEGCCVAVMELLRQLQRRPRPVEGLVAGLRGVERDDLVELMQNGGASVATHEIQKRNTSVTDGRERGLSASDEPEAGASASQFDIDFPYTGVPYTRPAGRMDIQVQPSTREFYDTQHKKKCYPMLRKGRVLILNVQTVTGVKEPRDGTDIDRDNLENLWKAMGFSVTVYNDKDGLTSEGIVKKVKNFSRRDHKEFDCAVVCILSHGFNGTVAGTDAEKVSIETLYSYFSNQKCASLAGKPKIFIFEACRGTKRDKGTLVEIDTTEEEEDNDDGNETVADAFVHTPTMTEFIKCFPTQSGYASWRETKHGTWFISALVEVFMQYSATEDIQTLLSMVSSTMAGRSNERKRKQMSEFTSSLSRKLYFFPGLNTDNIHV